MECKPEPSQTSPAPFKKDECIEADTVNFLTAKEGSSFKPKKAKPSGMVQLWNIVYLIIYGGTYNLVLHILEDFEKAEFHHDLWSIVPVNHYSSLRFFS